MARRFFAPIDMSSEQVTLTGSEAFHLLCVLRMKTGDDVTLFNGTGTEVLAKIAATTSDSATLTVLQRRQLEVNFRTRLTIATAVPKGDRFGWMIEKLTELNVHRVIPLITKRSIVDPGQGKLEKQRRTIVEACKQCGRSTLMELSEPQPWNQWLTEEVPSHTLLIAHPGGADFEWTSIQKSPRERPWLIAIGPEGGFTETEVDQMSQLGGELVQLGTNVLRIETAAVAAAALAGLQ